jgi:hypothetical protein
MEAIPSSETLVNFNRTTQHIPEDCPLQLMRNYSYELDMDDSRLSSYFPLKVTPHFKV